MKRKYIILLVVAPFWIIFDQLTKRWATTTFMNKPPIHIIDNFFTLRYVTNKGAAWGMFGNFREDIRINFFTLITIIAVIVLGYYYRKLKDNKLLLLLALASITGGMLGNAIDRIYVKYVVDFIDWHYYSHHWPTFNIADVAISVGMGLLILDWLIHHKEYAEAEKLKVIEAKKKKAEKKAQKISEQSTN